MELLFGSFEEYQSSPPTSCVDFS